MKYTKFLNSKWVGRHLPALAAAVAITLALAFTPRTVDEGFAINPDNGQWISLAGLEIDEDYTCEGAGDCVYEEPDTTSEVLRSGTFELKE